jgi:hypothetical protein
MHGQGAGRLALNMDADQILTLLITGELEAGGRSRFTSGSAWRRQSHSGLTVALNQNDAIIVLVNPIVAGIELLPGYYERKRDMNLQTPVGRRR